MSGTEILEHLLLAGFFLLLYLLLVRHRKRLRGVYELSAGRFTSSTAADASRARPHSEPPGRARRFVLTPADRANYPPLPGAAAAPKRVIP